MRFSSYGIGFFDSGIGGLTVMAECRRYIKDETFYYFGDNRHAPYGNLSQRKIKKYVNVALKKFEKLNVRAVVLACNTATAVCVEELRKQYSFPIIGAEPAVNEAAQKGGRVFVLATKATCQSAKFKNLLSRTKLRYPTSRFVVVPCQKLAGVIEKRIFDDEFDVSRFLPQGSPSAVVLGCTHYIYRKEFIENFYQCPVYDGRKGIVKRLQTVLLNNFSKNQSDLTMCSNQNRDRRPLFPFLRNNAYLSTTRNPFINKRIKTNECSRLCGGQNGSKKSEIIFLGSGKRKNKRVYERMFAEQKVESGQKSQKIKKN